MLCDTSTASISGGLAGEAVLTASMFFLWYTAAAAFGYFLAAWHRHLYNRYLFLRPLVKYPTSRRSTAVHE